MRHVFCVFRIQNIDSCSAEKLVGIFMTRAEADEALTKHMDFIRQLEEDCSAKSSEHHAWTMENGYREVFPERGDFEIREVEVGAIHSYC